MFDSYSVIVLHALVAAGWIVLHFDVSFLGYSSGKGAGRSVVHGVVHSGISCRSFHVLVVVFIRYGSC